VIVDMMPGKATSSTCFHQASGLQTPQDVTRKRIALRCSGAPS
jgi:hypothetical protein